MKFKYILAVSFLSLLSACNNDIKIASDDKNQEDVDQSQFEAAPQINDTTLLIEFSGHNYEVDIKTPVGLQTGTILVLQGWNFPNSDWCDSTSFCDKALEKGYILVFPEMGKSIYSENIYEETRSDWRKYPTRKWLRDSVIGKLQENFGLFQDNGLNFVLGLSTGGRGALLLALDLPNQFSGCATLSGDYDQSMFPNDNLYVGYWGKMKSFEDRWKKLESPMQLLLVKNLHVPLYVGHGLKDNVVPHKHLEFLKEYLEYVKPEVEVIYHTDSLARHDYSYWNSEVDYILEFFEKSSE